jgi:hypothetical protein
VIKTEEIENKKKVGIPKFVGLLFDSSCGGK